MTKISREVHDEMLDLDEPYDFDDSIKSLKFYKYTPITQADNNATGQISITINQQNTYLLPSKSYISIKGQIRRADNNNAYAADDEIALINNAMMHLFTEISYELGSTTIETINFPGPTTSMLGYLSYPDDFSTSEAVQCCWSKDTTDHASSQKYAHSGAIVAADGMTPAENPNYNQGFDTRKGLLFSSNPRGCFSFYIRLTHIFGFAEYKKLIHGMQHTLNLTRGSDTLALYRNNATADGKVDITNISWFMPQIEMVPEYLNAMRELIERKVTLPLAFRARTTRQITLTQTQDFSWRLSVLGGAQKPRWIIVGFQTNRKNSQQQNSAVFDHLNLRNACLTLNADRYPMLDIDTNFARNDYAELYKMFADFKKEYYGVDSLVGGTQVNGAAYKSLFPIIVFDARRQDETLKIGVTDIQVQLEFREVVPAGTTAYAVIISDRFFKLPSDGKNLTVVSM